MKLKRVSCILLLACLLITSCTNEKLPSVSEPYGSPEQSSKYSVVYVEQKSGYTVIASDLLDTLMIAGALYYDFESSNLCPSGSTQSYDDVKEHFAPFQSHTFVEQFEKYANEMMQDVDGEVVRALICYILSGERFSHWERSYIFADADEVNTFVDGLQQFYRDSGAEEFLKNSSLRQDMLAYIPNAAEEVPIAAFFQEMEAYVGNREQLFDDNNLFYFSLVTPFRPLMASFYECDLGENIYFVAQLAPYSFRKGEPASLDMRQIVATSIHESLHLFINDAVEDRAELIGTLAQNLSPADYTAQMYTTMPWHRITDEAVVRAVQAGIYRQVYNDSNQAYEELLSKEMDAGVVNLDHMYDALLTYEANRDAYPAIEDFVEILIEQYLDCFS